MCAYLGDIDSVDTYDSTIVNCLQDFAGEIRSDDCRGQVCSCFVVVVGFWVVVVSFFVVRESVCSN